MRWFMSWTDKPETLRAAQGAQVVKSYTCVNITYISDKQSHR